MTAASTTLCFTCSHPIADPPRFNALTNGEPCPACRRRVLEALPPALPCQAVAEVTSPEAGEPDPAPPPAADGEAG